MVLPPLQCRSTSPGERGGGRKGREGVREGGREGGRKEEKGKVLIGASMSEPLLSNSTCPLSIYVRTFWFPGGPALCANVKPA